MFSMKKILFFSALALIAASCTNEQTVETPKGEAIGFSASVGNLTKALPQDMKPGNVAEFYVAGYYQEKDEEPKEVFTSQPTTVTRTTSNASLGSCTIEETQYWIPGATYKFFALRPKIAINNFDFEKTEATIKGYEVPGDADVIFSNAGKESYTGKFTGNEKVYFELKHALSKIQFTFKSEWPTDLTVNVSDIKITGVKGTGNVTITYLTSIKWENQQETKDYNFENPAELSQAKDQQATTHLYLLPQTIAENSVKVSFDVTINGNSEEKKNFTATLPAGEWTVGNYYNYTITLNGEPIEIEKAAVAKWADNPSLSEDIDSSITQD